MDNNSIFTKIILSLSLISLIAITVSNFQTVKLLDKYGNNESLIQKIAYNFPIETRMNEKLTIPNNVELIVKDKNISEKLTSTYATIDYNYYGERISTKSTISPDNPNDRFIYVSTSITNISKKREDIEKLVSTKIIYDNKYEFEGFPVVENNNQTKLLSQNIYLMPLEKKEVFFAATLPANLVNSNKPISLEIKSGHKKYTLKIK